MVGITETINNAFSDWVDLYKRAPVPLFIGIAKVHLLQFLVSFVGIAIMFGVAFVFIGPSLLGLLALVGTNGVNDSAAINAIESIFLLIKANFLLILAIIVPFGIVFALLGQVVNSISFNVVDNLAKGKETSIMEKFSANLVPVVLYTLLIWVIILICLSPIALAVLSGNTLAALGALCFVAVALVGFLLIFHFLFQFSFFELVLNRRGVIDSLKRSFSLVKANLFTVILFDIVYLILAMAVGFPLGMAEFVIKLIGEVLASVGGVFGILLYVFVYTIFGLISGIITSFILLPLFYFFWKKVSGD